MQRHWKISFEHPCRNGLRQALRVAQSFVDVRREPALDPLLRRNQPRQAALNAGPCKQNEKWLVGCIDPCMQSAPDAVEYLKNICRRLHVGASQTALIQQRVVFGMLFTLT